MFRKRFLALFLVINIFGLFNAGYSQTEEKKYNQQYNPVSLIKRLSYENFKNIKLLRTAIMNYGGGEAEVQKLIDQYADATALYFEDKVEESATKFTENEREIFKIAKKLATGYSKDSSQFLKKGIKRNVQISIQQEVEGKQRDAVMEKYLDNAKSAQKRANSILDDYKYTNETNSSSAQRLVTSIYYYRLSKQNLFLMYQAYIEPMKLDPDKKKDQEMKDQLFDKMVKEDYKDDYKKDLQDNKNKIFTSMEKKV
ncbi:MAG TPA: hypothetical protein PKG60_05600 [Spirochaetota bacterium]|nr:hypothetical protein [Spirochaetota bacterium]HPS85114.1 hypothetical protein [Spirochaetota bacterium]